MPTKKELELWFEKGKITRREFLAGLSALGVTAAISPALLGSTAHAATPKKGGRFRMGVTGGHATDSLDPGTLTDMMPIFVTYQLRNCLVEIDHNSDPQPELAESWEATPDAKQWTFNLRKGIEFHNGKTLDAEDVIFSIRHHMTEESKSAAKPIVKPIKDIKADGKNRVTFTLAAGNADFPFIISDYHLQIVPADTTDWDKGIGTGGYTLVDFEPGVRTFVKRNPNYWKKGRAHFDEIETLGIADVNARTNALKTGQVDVINRCEKKTYKLLKKIPGIQGIETTGNAHYSWPMLTDRPPFNNNDARLAMKYALDREHMLKQILRGYGLVGNDHPIGPANRYRNTEMPQRKYDPDKAKYHFKKAGLEGQSINLHAANAGFPSAVDSAVLYKEHAAKAGININVVREPDDGYWSNVWIKKTWSACFWSGRPTEDLMFATAYAAGVPWNDSLWKHERFNKLLVEARALLDEKKRREIYYEMQRIVSDEGGVVVMAFNSWLQAASDKVQHGPIAKVRELDGSRCGERWWFKS